MRSSLQSKITKKRWHVQRNSTAMSNISMDGWMGGKLYVPPNEYEEFLADAARDIDSNIPIYIIERRTPIYKWHLDLDILDHEPLPLDKIKNISADISQVALATLNMPVGRGDFFIILGTVPKQKSEGHWKTGLHIIAPYLKVNSEQCLQVRDTCIPMLKEKYKILNTWEDAFDESVYIGSGLRLLGSNKMEMCSCKRKDQHCTLCNGFGKIDTGRSYSILDVITSKGKSKPEVVQKLKKNTQLALTMSSIKCFDVLPSSSNDTEVKVRKRTVDGTTELITGTPDSVVLNNLRSINTNYEKTRITKELRSDKCVMFHVDTKYCMNVSREHTSSNIYFVLSSRGLSQRCFSKQCQGFHTYPIAVSDKTLCHYNLKDN